MAIKFAPKVQEIVRPAAKAKAACKVPREPNPIATKPADATSRRGRPKLDAPKELVSLRLDPDVLAHFRAAGAGWQSRLNEALRKVAGL